jgi:Cu(I)/Ag(I) efflux system membrane protein CusA/SilA
MFETVIVLKPESEWRPGMTHEKLIHEMDQALKIPGTVNAWTMPIKNRIDMLATGIRTPVGIKVFGADLQKIAELGEHLEVVLRDVPGTRSVFAERTTGGLFLDIVPRREEIARYGLNVEDVLMMVESAIGGMAIDRTIEGRERYTINVRYSRELRDDPEKLKRVLVPFGGGAKSPGGETGGMDETAGNGAAEGMSQIPLGQLADISISSGPMSIKDEDGGLTGWVYVDIEGRDIGSYVHDAKKAVHEKIEKAGLLPTGYHLVWTGQYEFMLRVKARLKVVVPVTLALIFFLLYLNFKSLPATLTIMLSIPFAITGSIWILWLLEFNMSVAVWVGIIALAGLSAQTGIVMIVYLEEAFHAYQASGRMKTQYDLFEAITYGAVQRVRPKLMTVSTMLLGLLPLMWAHGAGADVMQRIAAPMIGGLITSSILTLEIVPAIYSLWRGRQVEWIPGPPPPRKTWDELSEQFHHAEATSPGALPP